MTSGAVAGDDGLLRTPWAYSHPLLLDYYDNEWGMPIQGESAMFERVMLEAFQAGLSWLTILKKRDAFRRRFEQFDADAVARFTDAKLEKLMECTDIIRNRQKITAARTNARATIALRDEVGLENYIWSFRPDVTPAPRYVSEIPVVSDASTALSKALRKRGFAFVGPTTMHALMEAVGIIDTHLVDSYRRGASGVWTK